jgi:hypothetical protein
MIRRITLDWRTPPGQLFCLIDKRFYADFILDKTRSGVHAAAPRALFLISYPLDILEKLHTSR